MKNKDIVIDFTSLLDVTLIIIFFFIMFSTFDTDNEKKKAVSEAQKTMVEADSKLNEADSKLEEAEKLQRKADEALAELSESDKRKAENIDAIMEFSQNENLKVCLNKKNSEWIVEIYKNNKVIKDMKFTDESALEKVFNDFVVSNGFKYDDTILCEFLYDASEPGSHKVYEAISNGFEHLRSIGYTHLYYSETDLSIMGGKQ